MGLDCKISSSISCLLCQALAIADPASARWSSGCPFGAHCARSSSPWPGHARPSTRIPLRKRRTVAAPSSWSGGTSHAILHDPLPFRTERPARLGNRGTSRSCASVKILAGTLNHAIPRPFQPQKSSYGFADDGADAKELIRVARLML